MRFVGHTIARSEMFYQDDRVLFIGAHPDDVEIGAGGTVHRLCTRLNASVELLILSYGTRRLSAALRELSSTPESNAPHASLRRYDPDSRHGESVSAAQCLGVKEENVHVANEFEDTRLHLKSHELIRYIEDFVFDAHGQMRFDAIVTHANGDRHSDHNQVHESTLAALRYFRGRILCYRSPSTKMNEFAPNHFEIVSEESMAAKLRALGMHASQRDKAFMREAHIRRMASEWTSFLNLQDSLIEQFRIVQSIGG
jgi:LmbE family N-acetylglucosaminyl deacetylase